jgi:glycosyltransferase involved in cell wall biosynthesis
MSALPHNSSQPKRALLIRNANSFDFGGAERFVVALAREIQALGYETTVASHHKGIKTYAAEQNVNFVRSPWLQSWQDYSGLRILLFPLFALWQLYVACWYIRAINKLQVSVIHPQSRDDFISATLAARWCKIKVVWTDHADLKYVYQNVPVPIKNPVGKWVWRLSKQAQAVTLVSNSEAQLITKAVGAQQLPDNYQVIYNGIRDTPVKAVDRTKDEQTSIIFCCTSRLVVAKGIGELIEATKQIAQTTNCKLWIVGDGPDAEQFRAQAANHPSIEFKGFQADALPYVAASDVFVHPSYHEGFSLSIVEAAKLGKPMIACNVGGNPEIVHDHQNGLLIEPRDPQSLATAMQALCVDAALRTSYGQNARTTFLSQFEFDHIVRERFIPIYEN